MATGMVQASVIRYAEANLRYDNSKGFEKSTFHYRIVHGTNLIEWKKTLRLLQLLGQ
jgi:hypothetical protein